MSNVKQGDYDFSRLEKEWQQYWLENKSFAAVDFDPRPKYYVLDMFPYPSGNGLHVGHVEGYTATDIVARFKRMRGYNVLHPMGWDAFGLPAEQYAIKTNTHPKITTTENIATFKRQILGLGYSSDWDREVDTTDPKYYRWTQWIFLQLFKKGLAYESETPVNWCPKLGTILANEEVVDGKSEVGGHPVEKRLIRQWVLKITEYAERLLNDLDDVDWPESTKEMQRNWIGKSHGCNITFKIKGSDQSFTCYSTCPETLFGATFCVLAPEHPLVARITTADQRAIIDAYVEATTHKSDLDRSLMDKEKTGAFTGTYAINPVNGAEIPVYIADYVLATYGSGAVMAVPGHDVRDHGFARKYGLPIVRVVTGGEDDIQKWPHPAEGDLVNSMFLDGLARKPAFDRVCAWLEEKKLGQRTINYRLRDWIFSRQRYWGEPFPLVYDASGKAIAVSEDDLPILLPQMNDFTPSGSEEPPLAMVKDWITFKKDEQTFRREANIMPQWAGSCWYYLRYLDPHNDGAAWDKAKEKYWMPVDLYVGGVEHANLHLLYARFWHKVLYDLGHVSTTEPFKKLLHQGLILGPNNEKMSKSRGNVVNPDDVIREWGADSLRMFEMFMGPLEAVKPWQTNGIVGVHRFLKRVWRLYVGETGEVAKEVSRTMESETVARALAKLTKKVTEDTEALQFNTAISAMMEFVNTVYKEESMTRQSAETFVLLLAPYAPHMAEELWRHLGHKKSLAHAPWPTFDPALVVDDSVTISVMIDGKTRGTITVVRDTPAAAIVGLAKEQEFVKRYLSDGVVKKEIVVVNKIVNFVLNR